jgi:hypothetical protein
MRLTSIRCCSFLCPQAVFPPMIRSAVRI